MTEVVGLLVCDHVSPELIDEFGDYPEMFSELLRPQGLTLEMFDVISGELPESVDQCRAWMVTGSRYSVYDDEPWIETLKDFVSEIAESEGCYVGICFGHQMLAHALGGAVRRSERGWGVGVKSVDVVATRDWMLPATGTYRILNSHADQVEALPEGGVLLAASEHCPIAMFEVGTRLLGIQGHPEFTPGYAETLLRRRRGSLIPEGVADAGLRTLTEEVDRELLASWVGAFLRGSFG